VLTIRAPPSNNSVKPLEFPQVPFEPLDASEEPEQKGWIDEGHRYRGHRGWTHNLPSRIPLAVATTAKTMLERGAEPGAATRLG
jgi:hypothetical protein